MVQAALAYVDMGADMLSAHGFVAARRLVSTASDRFTP